MIDDDKQTGRTLSRRELLGLLGVAGGGLLFGSFSTTVWGERKTSALSGLPGCVAKPELTEGPYFVDEQINRADIRTDPVNGQLKDGSLLDLEFRVSSIGRNECRPLAGAIVDVWHCDAQGIYSDVNDWQFDTSGQKFLRGYQVTNESGSAKFTTIYPGWYPGRAVHIHFKIRADKQEFTSQLFFDETLTDRVHAGKPYAKEAGRGRTRNERDGIYRESGNQLTLNLTETEKGHRAVFEIGLYV